MKTRLLYSTIVLGVVLVFFADSSATDNDKRCQLRKLTAIQKYYACVSRALMKAVKKGADVKAPAVAKCNERFDRRWLRAQGSVGEDSICHTLIEPAVIREEIRSDFREHRDHVGEMMLQPCEPEPRR